MIQTYIGGIMMVNQARGKLTIFFSYSYHIEITRRMLNQALTSGYKYIYIGELQENERIHQWVQFPYLNDEHRFDIDEALAIQPDLLIIDPCIYTNPSTFRHKKRYQDIDELLNKGINVYTILLIENIDSLKDQISEILERTVLDTVPDSFIDEAEEVIFVDQSPDLIMNTYRIDQLTMLRKLAMQRYMERMDVRSLYHDKHEQYEDHILVCITGARTNAKVIRVAARMADAYHARLTGLYIESNDHPSYKDDKQLKQNIALAEQFGAHVEIIDGDDIAKQILEYASLSNTTKIVLGHSQESRIHSFFHPSIGEQLIKDSPDLEVYIIPVKPSPRYSLKRINKDPGFISNAVKSILILLGVTLIGFLFQSLGFSEANIITVYILGVLLIAVSTSQRIYSLISSIVSVILFNFFFTKPHLTFLAYGSGYPATFIIMFISAFITSTLAVRINQNAKKSAQTAYRTKILLETSQMLQKEEDYDGIVRVTCKQMVQLLKKDIIFYPIADASILEPYYFYNDSNEETPDREEEVVQWVYKNNKQAGATTDTFESSAYLYFPINSNDKVYGIVGIRIIDKPIDTLENSILLSMISESGLALEKEYANKEKAKAEIRAKNEELHANLLRSISHDLRTPLTSISGNAGILLNSEDTLDTDQRKSIYHDIYQDALWLINLVENLLSITRIENGTMKLNKTTELLDEVIQEALKYTQRMHYNHPILYTTDDELILVKIDLRLMIQVLDNILDNANKYAPDGTPVEIKTRMDDDMVVIDIIDQGPGIEDNKKDKVFEMFYIGNTKVADSRRSLGLGLALCKSIVSAHEGTIQIVDNKPCGAIFKITLPIEEASFHEQ